MNPAILGRLRCIMLSVIILLSSGCATMQSGGARSSGAVTELNGRLTRTYAAGFPETRRASMMALGQLGIPTVRELSDDLSVSVKAVLPDGIPVTVEAVNIGADLTEVSVRAGTAGAWNRKVAESLQTSIAEMLSIFLKPAEGETERSSGKRAKSTQAAGNSQPSSNVSSRTPAGPRPQFTLFFGANSNDFSAGQMKQLDKIARRILKIPNTTVWLNGYTDSLGSVAYNKMISEARASAVKFYLISRGISPENIKVTGYGPQNFIADNKTRQGRNKNRRVEIVIHTEKRKSPSSSR